jgi:hypothetical protein
MTRNQKIGLFVAGLTAATIITVVVIKKRKKKSAERLQPTFDKVSKDIKQIVKDAKISTFDGGDGYSEDSVDLSFNELEMFMDKEGELKHNGLEFLRKGVKSIRDEVNQNVVNPIEKTILRTESDDNFDIDENKNYEGTYPLNLKGLNYVVNLKKSQIPTLKGYYAYVTLDGNTIHSVQGVVQNPKQAIDGLMPFVLKHCMSQNKAA